MSSLERTSAGGGGGSADSDGGQTAFWFVPGGSDSRAGQGRPPITGAQRGRGEGRMITGMIAGLFPQELRISGVQVSGRGADKPVVFRRRPYSRSANILHGIGSILDVCPAPRCRRIGVMQRRTSPMNSLLKDWLALSADMRAAASALRVRFGDDKPSKPR